MTLARLDPANSDLAEPEPYKGKLTKADLEKVNELGLLYPKITDAGLKEVAKLQQLRRLTMYGTKVTKVGVAELQKALPKCKITHNAKKQTFSLFTHPNEIVSDKSSITLKPKSPGR
jgi:hypothetical protein